MRYVITGASGHIGNNLVRLIEQKEPNAEIVTLTRRTIGKELDGTRARQAVGDLFSESFLNEHIREGDFVVHLAGLIDLTDTKREESYRVNYILTKTITDFCEQKRVKKYVYVGSVDGIYKCGEGKIVEPNGYEPEKIEGNYGKTKAMAMGYVFSRIRENSSFNAAMVMPSAVIGENDYKPSAVGGVILNTLRGKAEFGVRGGYNFVGVREVCEAIYTLLHSPLCDQYILSGESVTVEELYGFINREKGLKKKPIILPTWLVRLFVPFVKVLSKITLKALSEPHDYSSEKAKRELGFLPPPVEETLKKTIAWFDEHKDNF